MNSLKRSAWGKIEIFLYHPTEYYDKKDAIAQATSRFNSQTVIHIEGDIHTADGSSYPFDADKCRITWLDAKHKEEI